MNKKVNYILSLFALLAIISTSTQISFGQGKVTRNSQQTKVQSSTPKKSASKSNGKSPSRVTSSSRVKNSSATPTTSQPISQPQKRSKPSGWVNGYEAVDLGLSVRWASCNIGANKPYDFGEWFTFGDVTRNKYTGDPKDYVSGNIIGTSHDIAKYYMGSEWRMPTVKECEELVTKCKSYDRLINGIWGRMVYGPNGNSIFLPYAGIAINRSDVIDYSGKTNLPTSQYKGIYFSGEADKVYVTGISIAPNKMSISNVLHKFFGATIRPVTD